MVKPTVRVKRKRPVGAALHWDLWFHAESGAVDYAAALLTALAEGAPVTLELLDCDPPARRKLDAGGWMVTDRRPGIATVLLSDAGTDEAMSILTVLQSQAFTAWVGVMPYDLPATVRDGTNRRRAQALRPGSAYLVFSLYDDNIALYAPIGCESAVAEKIVLAARQTGYDLT